MAEIHNASRTYCGCWKIQFAEKWDHTQQEFVDELHWNIGVFVNFPVTNLHKNVIILTILNIMLKLFNK